MTPNYPNFGGGLLPIVEGEPIPEYRLKNARHAQNIVSVYVNASLERNRKNAAFQGQIDGNPPYRQSVLIREGRRHDPNVNFLGAEGMRNTALVPYFDLFSGSRRFVQIKTEFPEDDERLRSQYSRIISKEYTRMLKRWSNHTNVMQAMLTDFVTFGKGFLMWETLGSWRCTHVPYYRALVSDGTTIDLDKVELVIVLQDWTISELYGKIRNKKAATDGGWDVENTMSALCCAVPKTIPGNDFVDSIAVQQAIRDDDMYVSQMSSSVPTATLFVKEYDGKWSECIVRRYDVKEGDRYDPAKAKDDKREGFLFESRKNKESILDSIVPFFFKVSDKTWNGASGIARTIYSANHAQNRLYSTQLGAVFLRNSLVLQPRQALDKNRLNLMQVGPVTWIPEGCDVHQGTFLGDIASTIQIGRELSSVLQQNTGIYMPMMEKGPGNPKTASQFQTELAQATVVSTAGVDNYYTQQDRFYQAQWKRVVKPGSGSGEAEKEARLFLKRCKDQGVPQEALDKIESIAAWRAIGNGSVAKRQETLQGFMSLYPLLGLNGKQNLMQDVIETAGSESMVERYMPKEDWENVANDQKWAANMENVAFKVGGKVEWTPSQNNVVHATTHMEAAGEAAASLEQGGDPVQVLHFMDAIAPHVLLHINHAMQDPTQKDAVKTLQKQWGKLAQTADQLRAKVQQDMQNQQQQQQKTQQVMTDAQIAQFSAQEDAKLKSQKALGGLQLKGAKQQADQGMKQTALQADLARKDAATASEIQRKNALAIAEANRKETQSNKV